MTMAARSKRVLLFLAAVLVLAGCGTVNQTPDQPTTWRDPAYTGPGFRKILVIGLNSKQLTDQRGFENLMVSTLQSASVVALPGWEFLPTDHMPDQATMRAVVRNMGADAVLLIRSSGFSTQSQAVPIMGPIVPLGAGLYDGWYQTTADVDYQVATIYTTLFDVATERPVWTYNPPAYNPAMLQQNAPAFANNVVNLLQSNGLIATR
jgi:hypothetical protein